jgi:hypothetical protein
VSERATIHLDHPWQQACSSSHHGKKKKKERKKEGGSAAASRQTREKTSSRTREGTRAFCTFVVRRHDERQVDFGRIED